MVTNKLKGLILLVAMTLAASPLLAQNSACWGLNNPTKLSNYNIPNKAQYTGAYGGKPEGQSNCNTGQIALNFTNTISNDSLDEDFDFATVGRYGQGIHPLFEVITTPGNDANTGNRLPMIPAGFKSSVRIGYPVSGNRAQALYYTMNVTNENKLVFINYAVVFQSPGHFVYQNPEFAIRVTRKNDEGVWVPVSDTMCYVVSSTMTNIAGGTVVPGQDGWHLEGTATNGVLWREWNQCVVNLSQYYGRTVRLEIFIGSCSMVAHYSYCYITGDCTAADLAASGCAAGSSEYITKISAPKGMAGYDWYRSKRGVLSGSERDDLNNYEYVGGGAAADSVFEVLTPHFVNPTTHETFNENTFMCIMTSYMDPRKPIKTPLPINVGNMKPNLFVDSNLLCDGSITLTDLSYTPFDQNLDKNKVDTNLTVWKFYDAPTPTEESFVAQYRGGTANHRFAERGAHSVVVRTSARDTTCWNEKTVKIRTMKPPVPVIELSRNDLCSGDIIVLMDQTANASWHKWIYMPPRDTTYISPTKNTQFKFDTTTAVRLVTHDNVYFRKDTNGDGIVDTRYCYVQVDTVVRVEKYPDLTMTGDSIVCNGTESQLHAASDVAGTSFDWFTTLGGRNPIETNSATLTIRPTHDMRYYALGTTQNGCETWDSIDIFIVDPSLKAPVTSICDKEEVMLIGNKAYSFTWTATPNDPSLASQANNDTIRVTPHTTTTYTLVGHGMNNCSASPLTQTITVFPYPVPAVEVDPGFIDSENPDVTFRDVSEGATTSLWNFGNGHTSTEREVVHTFTDLSQDSVLVRLTTGNEQECTSDTAFYVPIELFSVWFPNAITPTLNTNRTFKCITNNELEHYKLFIYNRNGQLVYQSTNQADEWDGKMGDDYVPQGVYTYICTYRRPGLNEITTLHGTLTIIH